MITIDGRHGEGGGQILRTALTLAALTGQPFTLTNIRAGRKTPGLAPQHLATVRLLGQLCAAEVTGARLGSLDLTFTPQSAPLPGNYVLDVAQVAGQGSAGAVTLIAQAALLPLAFAPGPSTLTLTGGTHVAWSPPSHYLSEVFLPLLAPLGLSVEVELRAWGFYPVGGGQLHLRIPGHTPPLAPLTLTERGPLTQLSGWGVAASLPADIAQRLSNRARNQLADHGFRAAITPQRVKSAGAGAAVWLLAEYANTRTGVIALGAQGKPAHHVADEAVAAWLAFHQSTAPVDAHLADQLLLPLLFATGPSHFVTTEITEHLRTNAATIDLFLPGRVVIRDDAAVTVSPA